MIASIETKPLVVHHVTGWPYRQRPQQGSFEIRSSSFRTAADLLGMSVPDLDSVRDARSRADLVHCPVCRTHAA